MNRWIVSKAQLRKVLLHLAVIGTLLAALIFFPRPTPLGPVLFTKPCARNSGGFFWGGEQKKGIKELEGFLRCSNTV